jgi:hypothetical protein
MSNTTLRLITDQPTSALEQIQRQLGPEAIVLSVRRLPAHGVARLWQKNGPIEILAGVPDQTRSGERQKPSFAGPGDASPVAASCASSRWQSVARLQALGLLPAYAARLQRRLDALYPLAPATPEAEWEAVRAALTGFWPASRELSNPAFPGCPDASGGILPGERTGRKDVAPARAGLEGCATPPGALQNRLAARTHVFVGPPGSGKTTALCKWLTLAVLSEEHSARVWRLNGTSANTAEFLTVHCEMLDVPIERFWSQVDTPADLHFIDLPGAQMDDARALADLRRQLSELPSPEVHLVLNSAYETEVLLDQCHAFAGLKPSDLILTHCDEKLRPVKLWNLVLGTNYMIRFLSTGQKIPGGFHNGAPDLLFPSEITQ